MSAPGSIRRLEGSERDNWATPAKLFDKLHDRFDFNLDVCADETNAKCATWLGGRHSDGLEAPWGYHGTRAFMNPPYSQAKAWIEKAISQRDSMDVIVGLLTNGTENKWFTRLIYPTASEVIFLEGRVQFDEPPEVKAAREAEGKKKNGNTGGNILAVWRRDSIDAGYPRFSVWDWDA